MSAIDMSLKNNFPSLRLHRRPLIPSGRPNDIISTIITAVAVVAGATTSAAGLTGLGFGIGFGLMVTWTGLATVIVAATVIGLSVWSMVSGQKGKAGSGAGAGGIGGGGKTLDQGGQLVNTRQAGKVLPIIYGIARIGGNWVLGRPSSNNENILNIAITWSEGEIEGLATAIDYTSLFSGSGVNDLHTGGEFVPTTSCTCDGPCYSHTDCSCEMTCYSTYA